MHARRAPAIAVAIALGTTACSAILSWDDFSGSGFVDGGASAVDGGDGVDVDAVAREGGEGDAATTCTAPSGCVTAAPSGWAGPVALFGGPASQGARPPCGPGFDATPVFDGNADLTAAPATCSACACGAPSSVMCTSPELTFYQEQSCTTPCGTPVVLSGTCTLTAPTCRGVAVAAPKATGGSCAASGGAATTTPLAWGKIARACAPIATPTAAGCAPGQVCGPLPAAPFGTHACILQAGVAASCPAEYPVGPRVYYANAADTRGCTACTCTAPSGGHCSVGSPAGYAYVAYPCIKSAGTFDAPSACAPWNGGTSVTLGSSPVVDDAGACTPSGGAPTGDAVPAHPTSFCCAL